MKYSSELVVPRPLYFRSIPLASLSQRGIGKALLQAATLIAALLLISGVAAAQPGNCALNGDGSCKNVGAGCTGDSGVGKCTNIPNGSGGQSCKCVGRCATDKGTVCANPDPPKGLVRVDIDNKDYDLQAFRDGVKAMMDRTAKDPNDPLGWNYQAYIHGRNATAEAKLTAQDCCQHSGWFFLSWHRMEIYYFERIVRALSGNPNLTVPYWNATDQIKADKRKVPLSFRTAMYTSKGGAEVKNPLYYKARRAGMNDPGSKPLCTQIVKWEDAFKQTKFFVPTGGAGSGSFGGTQSTGTIHPSGGEGTGSLENVPHNSMHQTIGDDTPLSLSDPDGAGLDPLFWPFHVNLDRAWYYWQKAHPGTLPAADSNWSTQQFIFFDVEMVKGKPQAKQVCLTGKQVVDIANQLGYTYDTGVPFTNTESKPGTESDAAGASRVADDAATTVTVVSATREEEVALGAETVTVSLQLPEDVQRQIHGLLANPASDASLVLSVDDIRANKLPSSMYDLYVNLPNKAVLEDEGRYYAGNLNFFGLAHMHRGADMAKGMVRSFDITDVVRQLAANNEWQGDRVNLTFAVPEPDPVEDCVMPPPTTPEANLRFEKLTLSVNTVKPGGN